MQAIHTLQNLILATRPAYRITKAAEILALQVVADATTPDKMQVINYHAGVIHTPPWPVVGVTKDMVPFNEGEIS